MSTSNADVGSTGALFRLLSTRLAISALGVFRLSSEGAQLWAATEAFDAIWRGNSVHRVSPVLAAALASGEASRIETSEFGFTEGFAAVAPVLSCVSRAAVPGLWAR